MQKYQLQKRNYRQESLPFDYIVSKRMEHVIQCLDDDFKNFIPTEFCDKITTNYVDMKTLQPNIFYKASNSYHLKFVHHYSPRRTTKEVNKSLARKVKRFQSINLPIIFYRLDSKKSCVIKLNQTLQKYFTNFTLRWLVTFETDQNAINLPEEFIDWKRNNIQWDKIFAKQ